MLVDPGPVRRQRYAFAADAKLSPQCSRPWSLGFLFPLRFLTFTPPCDFAELCDALTAATALVRARASDVSAAISAAEAVISTTNLPTIGPPLLCTAPTAPQRLDSAQSWRKGSARDRGSQLDKVQRRVAGAPSTRLARESLLQRGQALERAGRQLAFS